MSCQKPAAQPSYPKTRKLKVYNKILTRGTTVVSRRPVIFSEIRLVGRWLIDCGFHPGQDIEITIRRNKLTITHTSGGGN